MAPTPRLVRAGNLVLDRDRYTVTVAEQPVELTYAEFEVLAALLENRGRVLSPRELVEMVWGEDSGGGARKLAVYISRLRRKIAGSWPWAIRTVMKRGYSLSEVGSASGPWVPGGGRRISRNGRRTRRERKEDTQC